MNLTLIILVIIIIVALFYKSYISDANQNSAPASQEIDENYDLPLEQGNVPSGVDENANEDDAPFVNDQQIVTPIPPEALNTDEKYPLQGVMYEYGGIPDGSSPVGQFNANVPCKPFSLRPGVVYFPATEHMGDNASAQNGIMGFGGQFQPVDMCKKLHCVGCGKCSYQANAPVKDTDDIRRNYPELIDRLRAARTDEFPFLKL